MIQGLFGDDSTVGALRQGLGNYSAIHKNIAQGVANALTPGFEKTFQEQLDSQGVVGDVETDLEKNMVALADNQIKYEASSRLLAKIYSQLRTTMRNG